VTLKIVAQRADGWDCDMLPLEDYDRKLAALSGHCATFGRDPVSIHKTIHFPAIIASDESVVMERAQAWAARHGTTLEGMHGRCLFGIKRGVQSNASFYAEFSKSSR